MTKKTLIGLIVLVMIALPLTGCVPYCAPRRDQLADTGLFGEHELKRIERFGTVEGFVQGNFFLGIGSIAGNIGSEFKLQFYWEPKPDEIVITSLPYSKFRFIIDDTKEVPTVEFVFDEDWLDCAPFHRGGGSYEYDDSEKANLNNWVMSDKMVVAVVRISRATLEKEVYLPKVD